MAFHESYSNLLNQLPPSIIKAGWIRLTTRKKNPLSENEANGISPIIESFLKHEVNRYQKNKQLRYNPIQNRQQISLQSDIQVINSEEEINSQVKEATDAIHQRFIESTQEQLESIKQQSDARCEQVKLDITNWDTKLFESSLKKYIRDGTIYYLIHELEKKDGKTYSDISRKN
jgi:hypothetical protein